MSRALQRTASKAFLAAFTASMANEGGYSFDDLDPGGETIMGISRVYWPEWEGWPIVDNADKNNIPLSMVQELPPLVRMFYRQNFWSRLRGDELAKISEPVASELFDTAVNLGVHQASKYLQQALNLLNGNQKLWPDIIEDGLIGGVTLSTLRLFMARRPMPEKTKQQLLLNVLNCLQGMHYIGQMRRYPEKERFRGWFLRI